MTIEEYLAQEEIAEFKSDYWKMVTTIGLDKSIYLHTLDTYISMQDIYQNARELQEPNF